MESKENQLTVVIEKVLRDTQNCDMSIETLTDYLVDRIKDKVIPKDSVIIPKEVSCYQNIEERVKTFRIDGNNVDFTAEQIMALTQILHFKEKQENDIRKETAEKILNEIINIIKTQSVNDYNFDNKVIEEPILLEKLKEISTREGIEIKE